MTVFLSLPLVNDSIEFKRAPRSPVLAGGGVGSGAGVVGGAGTIKTINTCTLVIAVYYQMVLMGS